MRLTLALAPLLVCALTGTLAAQQPDSSACPDRLGPSMSTLVERQEPVFTDPYQPGHTVYRRILEIGLADSVAAGEICGLLREYDLLLIAVRRSDPVVILVLTRRAASSLEELEHWQQAIAAAAEVKQVLLVPLMGPLVRPLGRPMPSARGDS